MELPWKQEGTVKSPGVSVEAKEEKERTSQSCKNQSLKGLFTIFFYRSKLIFWVVMGCGIADFGRRGL